MPGAPEIRSALVTALEADLVGPFDPTATEEHLTIAPSRWYLTGFLAPQAARETQGPTADEEFRGTEDQHDEEAAPSLEPEPKQKNHFPASLGMSVLLPPATPGTPDTLRVTVRFADYLRHDEPIPDSRKKNVTWRRVPQSPPPIELALDPEVIARGTFLSDTLAVEICGKLEAAPGLAADTRALSLFVVNRRPPGEKGRNDESFLFQVEMELHASCGFLPRPNRQGEASSDLDDRTADLQFRDHYEWGVGHNVSVCTPTD